MKATSFRRVFWTLLSFGAAAAVLGRAGAANVADVPTGSLAATDLRTEALENPRGIDATAPRLSWIVTSPRRGSVQTAYQIQVGNCVSKDLEASWKNGKITADLWDSGKVASAETTGIAYQGKPLASHQYVSWRVRVWDKDGKPSAWSQAAIWSMGLLKPTDLIGKWIGYDASRKVEGPVAALEGVKWIWHAADKGDSKPKAHRLFVTSLDLPADAKVEKAELLLAADDASKFTVNGTLVATSEGHTNVVAADIASHLKPGANTLRVEVENKEASPAGLLAKVEVKLVGGKVVTKVTDASWKTLADPGANWHNRSLDTSKWPAAAVLGEFGMAPWGKLPYTTVALYPVPHLRTGFTVKDKPVRHATLYAASLGLFDVYVNGHRVNREYFPSGWTDYTKRVYYRAYDVTDHLNHGQNAMGALLADGWYSGYVGFGAKRDHYGKKPRLLAQLHIEYADGTTDECETCPAWKASTGPILEADFLQGETYDARKSLGNWSTAGFDDSKWNKVDVGAEVSPRVEAHPGPPVVVFDQIKPKSIKEVAPRTFVLDMGQNFAGVACLQLHDTTPGQKVTLRFAERLNPDGTIYTTNLRSARSIDNYICKGGAEEHWSPRFTFHGFQYVEITGLTGPPSTDTITGLALSSDTPVVGCFACSDPMLEKIHSNGYWTQRANFIDIPTDCPQRDERLGWTGDAQVYIRAATLNTDVQAFFTKWLVDLTDGQRKDGQFPMVAPVKVAGDDGGPAWADAGVICPWTVYYVYGDKPLLARQYPAMIKFIKFCHGRCPDGLLPPKQYHCFGDWLSINADTPKDIIFTAYYAHVTSLTARAAEVLGKTEDAKRLGDLAAQIRAAFNKAYVAPDGRIKGDTQACYVLALAFDLVEGERAKQAAKYLVADIEKKGWHLSTGFIGTKDLMLALSKIGRSDVAYRLLHNTTFPSWGFSIQQGATSIWERWDGWTPEKGFQDPGMNSFAHYSFGAVYQWMVENIGGIRAGSVAYKTITIAPVLDPKLTSAKITYRSVRGEIASSWARKNKNLMFEVTVPANTTAFVHIPAGNADDVSESGKPLAQAEGVSLMPKSEQGVVVGVGSGHYSFVIHGTF